MDQASSQRFSRLWIGSSWLKMPVLNWREGCNFSWVEQETEGQSGVCPKCSP